MTDTRTQPAGSERAPDIGVEPRDNVEFTKIQRGSSAVKACSADCELRVGARLLIVVTSEPVAKVCACLAQTFAEGKWARDEGNFNRFRLVVQTKNPAQEREMIFRAFEAVAEKDERTHLHVLGKTEVPNLFV